MNAKTIGVISIKGGVGKTSCTANLGVALAKEFGKKVLMVDANFTAPNLGLHFGVVDPKYTVHDVLLDKVDIKEAILEHNGEFHILPAALIDRKVNPFKLKQKLQNLKSSYDFILLDSSPNLNEEILATMIASDELLVVTSPDYPTLSTTMRAINVAKQKKTPITGLVLNKVRGKKFELSIEEIENSCGCPVIGFLPDEIAMLESVANTTSVVQYKPNAETSVEFKKLAASLVGSEYKDPRLWNKLKSVFKGNSLRKVDVNRAVYKEAAGSLNTEEDKKSEAQNASENFK